MCTIQVKMTKPRLLVLVTDLPEDQRTVQDRLESILGKRIGGVKVAGSVAQGIEHDNFLFWTVLGQDNPQRDLLARVQRGCELFVGIKTKENDKYGGPTEDGKYQKSQYGERGFDLARQAGIPALLLDTYDQRTIIDFVQNNTSQ